jgi:hypothetical protein
VICVYKSAKRFHPFSHVNFLLNRPNDNLYIVRIVAIRYFSMGLADHGRHGV